jgi:hypothetical protein
MAPAYNDWTYNGVNLVHIQQKLYFGLWNLVFAWAGNVVEELPCVMGNEAVHCAVSPAFLDTGVQQIMRRYSLFIIKEALCCMILLNFWLM